jgi:hypothetical protein
MKNQDIPAPLVSDKKMKTAILCALELALTIWSTGKMKVMKMYKQEKTNFTNSLKFKIQKSQLSLKVLMAKTSLLIISIVKITTHLSCQTGMITIEDSSAMDTTNRL